jgi:membrane protease YdiL (CAAX protease family)
MKNLIKVAAILAATILEVALLPFSLQIQPAQEQIELAMFAVSALLLTLVFVYSVGPTTRRKLPPRPPKVTKEKKKAARKAAPKEARIQGPWWLGAVVVYVCMLSAMLLVGLLTSSIGLGSATAKIQVFVDNDNIWDSDVVAGGPVAGGWNWFEINENVSKYTGLHTLTIRWMTTDGTVGIACFDNLRLGDNLIDDFETDFATNVTSENQTVNGWTYHERDTDNVLDLQMQTDHAVSGTGWEFNAPANTAAGDYAQITKSFNFDNVDNLRLWTWTSWDLREVSDVISHIVTYSVALIVVYLHVSRFERRKFWPSVGIKREGMLKSVVWVFALSVIFTGILYIYWTGVNTVMGGDPQSSIKGFFDTSPDWYFLYLSFAFFIPVALTEELIFRGFIIERFSVKGPVKAVVFSSILFTSLHLWYASFGSAALPLYGGLFLVAMWWAIVYWKTRNLFGLILAHGLFNLGTAVEHFWVGGRTILESSVFMVGVACLGYLTFLYLKNMFIEMETLVKKR